MDKERKQQIKEGLYELFINLIIICILVVGIRSFIVSPFQVSGPSMCDTLNTINGKCVETGESIGEFMLINKFKYFFSDPERGDIVVFRPPNDERHYIKRIIGVPGDTVEIKKDNFVYLYPQGKEEIKLEETYLNAINYGNTQVDREEYRKFEIPEGGYFVMGDNRAHSSDSRHCFSMGGCWKREDNAFITKDKISGKAFVTLWPPANIKLIKGFDYGF